MSLRQIRNLFRWQYLLYAAALSATAIAVYGAHGVAIAGALLLFWGFVFVGPARPENLIEALVISVVFGVFAFLMWPVISPDRPSSWRGQCRNNLMQIGLALYNYHDDYDAFPPAVTRNAEGQSMHSWRVLLLPYMDGATLYRQYDLNQPWDSPQNRALIKQMPSVYSCPEHEHGWGQADDGLTSYAAIVGEDSGWLSEGSRTLEDFGDGAAETVLVTEWAKDDIVWTEPRDLSPEAALGVFAEVANPDEWFGHSARDDFYEYESGWHVLFADGSVKSVGRGIGQDAWASLFTFKNVVAAEGNGALSSRDLVRRYPRWGNWIALGSFLFLALLPVWWVWGNPGIADKSITQRD